jgi:hypothetical protein
MRPPALAFWLAALLAWSLSLCSVTFAKGEAGLGDPWGRRIALVVGNSTYSGRIESLKNATNDADAIARALRKERFEVDLVKDADLATLKAAIARLEKAAANADVVLLYYSGHGFQLGGQNHLVPTDAVLDSREVIDQRTVRLDDIISQLDSPDHQTLILLDACRNNPLPPSVRGNDPSDGLAQVTRMVNTYVAFSTQPGNVSVDGTGSNSPFATALVNNLDLPGKTISDVMVKVRGSVLEATNNLQQPFEQSTLTDYFYFNPETQAKISFGLSIAAADTGTPPTQIGPGTPATQIATGAMEQPATPAADEPAPVIVASLPEASAPVPDHDRSVPEVGAVEPPTYEMIDITEPPPATATGNSAPTSPQPRPEATPRPEQQVATLEPPPSTTPEPPAAPILPDDLPSAVQQKLKDVGCYTNAVDGDWGAGSRAALQRFFDAKKEPAIDSDPTGAVYLRLKQESGRVCEEQVVATPKPQTQKPASTPRPSTPPKQASTPRAPSQPKPQPQPSAPPAPPKQQPNFNSGGIGVFR